MLYKCKHCYCKAKEGIEKQRFLEITKFFIFEDVLLTFLFKCYQKQHCNAAGYCCYWRELHLILGLSPAKGISAKLFLQEVKTWSSKIWQREKEDSRTGGEGKCYSKATEHQRVSQYVYVSVLMRRQLPWQVSLWT